MVFIYIFNVNTEVSKGKVTFSIFVHKEKRILSKHKIGLGQNTDLESTDPLLTPTDPYYPSTIHWKIQIKLRNTKGGYNVTS